jgi:uncharacterized protein YjbI with pentapeptide repeats
MLHSNSIGSKIAKARKNAGLSQSQLADQVSISAQAVGKWERGESMPDITTLNRLAEIFGVDLNYFSDKPASSEKSSIDTEPIENEGFFFKVASNLGLNWNLSGDSYVEADFSEIKNIKDKLNGSSFKKCKLTGADLQEIKFKGNSIRECDFSNANLRNSKFWGSEIKASSFVNASLVDGVMQASEIRDCDFSNANLSGIEMSSSEFRNNKTENTNWQHAAFKHTQFTEITFNGTLQQCSFTGCSFSKVKFENVTFKNCFFKYCDLKKAVFNNCTADRLSYEFLKNCKAVVTVIDLIK